jgi:hypothetical protein
MVSQSGGKLDIKGDQGDVGTGEVGSNFHHLGSAMERVRHDLSRSANHRMGLRHALAEAVRLKTSASFSTSYFAANH